jgi:hypothetical protein
VGVEEDDKQPGDELLGFKSRLLMGAIFAALYIGTFGPRTGWVAGILSGVLGGAVVFLLLREVDERRKARRRAGIKPYTPPVRRKHRR